MRRSFRATAFAGLSMLAGCLAPATPAHAASSVAIVGTGQMPGCSGNGTFDGAGTGVIGTSIVVSTAVHADFTHATSPVVQSTADGNLIVAGEDYGFHWQMVAGNGVMTFDTGGVASITWSPPPSCGSTGTVTITGVLEP